ncbi:hypothetical protein [Clostridium sp.]|uniref:hypothetical protein n=1 Tax=Clostridium sp. TaxID=1506 RepID=UPI00321705A7
MFNLITRDFKGCTITLGITGLPVVITGEVIEANDNTIGLRLDGGNKIYIAANLIAFFY